MENLIIEARHDTPFVLFDTSGRLKMEGRALPEYPAKFFEPLYDWVKRLQAEKVVFDVKLDYFNTSTSKCLLDLFKAIESNLGIKLVQLNWHYEEGDDENHESGKVYEELLPRIQFKFFQYAEAVE